MDYYRDIVTQQSWKTLQALAQEYTFVLIGGWAVWLWTKRMKSKDIDIVIDFPGLTRLKEGYPFTKNDRLKKYEAIEGPVAIDIYVPHWSTPGIPAEDLLDLAVSREGFRVVKPEALLVTKQAAYAARTGSAKGRKDLIDIVSLLLLEGFNWEQYQTITKQYNEILSSSLVALLAGQTSIPELDLNPHAYARAKKRWLPHLA